MAGFTIPTQIPPLRLCYDQSTTQGAEFMIDHCVYVPVIGFSNCLAMPVEIVKILGPWLLPSTLCERNPKLIAHDYHLICQTVWHTVFQAPYEILYPIPPKLVVYMPIARTEAVL